METNAVQDINSTEVTNDIAGDSGNTTSSNHVSNLDVRRIKVDGEYVDVPISKLEESYGLESASRKRFEDAAALRKQVDDFLDSLQKGDIDQLMGIVPEDKIYDFAEKMLRKKIEWEETPEDKKARITAERERDQYKQELEEYSRKEQKQINQYVNNVVAEEIDSEISEVLTQLEKTHGKIVKSPEFVQDIARVMLAQLEKGQSNVNAKKAAELAFKSWKNRIGSYVSNISQDDLKTYLSKEQLSALRQSDLDSALSQFPSSNKKGELRDPPKKKQSLKGFNDFFTKLDTKFGA